MAISRDYKTYAEFYRFKLDRKNVNKYLSHAIDIFEECDADGWVKNVKWNFFDTYP